MADIIAKIQDENGKVIKRISGKFKNNQIVYKDGAFPLLFWQLGGKEEILKCNFADVEKDKKPYIARYEYDGKDYVQLSYRKVGGKEAGEPSTNDYYTYFHLAWLEKEKMRTKPQDLGELFRMLFLIAVIIMAIINYLEIQQLAALQKPIENLTHSMGVAIPAFLNVTQEDAATNNGLLTYYRLHSPAP